MRVLQRLVAESAVASITLGGALLAGSLLIIGTSTNPFGIIGTHGPTLYSLGQILNYPFNAFASLFTGAVGAPDLSTISGTIDQTIPLIFTGLSVAFAFRGGLFNIGGEGQVFMGAIAAAWIGITFASAPATVLLPLVLISAVLAGLLWGAIAGFLKAYRGAHEVISTIMLNWIAIYGTSSMVTIGGPLNSAKAQGQAVSDQIGDGGRLPLLSWLGSSSTIHAGIYLALAAVAIYWFVISRTSVGYEIRAVGLNAGAAAYGGIPVKRRIVLAMAVAGGLAGLAGGIAVADPTGSGAFQFQSASPPGWGFDGITIALLGKGNPIGIVVSALLIASLHTGSNLMQSSGHVNAYMTQLLQGIIVLFVALDLVVRKLLVRRRRATATARDTAGIGLSGAGLPISQNAAAAQAWRGLVVLSSVMAIFSVIFSHYFFFGLAFVLALLYGVSQRRPTRGVVLVIAFCVVCLALGLAVNQYLVPLPASSS